LLFFERAQFSQLTQLEGCCDIAAHGLLSCEASNTSKPEQPAGMSWFMATPQRSFISKIATLGI
jgi:hypothetical protein